MKTLIKVLAFVLSLQQVAVAAERPPQFVLFAFDNCLENQSWKMVSQFLEEMNARQRDRIRFTFFLSATGLLANRNKMVYTDPLGRQGQSNIGFGGSDLSVIERVQWINKLHREGNEIGSHAVGHFSGKDWSVEQWRHEFKQYAHIIDHVAELNGYTGEQARRATLAFKAKDLKGFRAPYLDGGANLNQVLAENRFTYDTSDLNQGADPSAWPKKFMNVASGLGLWNFGLPFINLPLTVVTKDPVTGASSRVKVMNRIITMDYNFCSRQTDGCPVIDPYAAEAERDAAEMLLGYSRYFLSNYNGNRAPVHFGHHFAPYRNGAYNRALMKLAKAICGLPEVRCTTYRELEKFMEKLGPRGRSELQSGNFPKMTPLKLEDLRFK